MADMRQVAAEAGVSTATVSRVLSGKGPVSAVASAKVRDAARRLHYTPSASAASLRTERSMIIGVLVPNLANPVFLPLLRAVEHLAQAHGYAVIVADTQRSIEVERRQLDRMAAQRIDALVVAGRPSDPDHVRRLADGGLPVADADALEVEAGMIGASLPAVVAEVVDHLAGLGHERIGYVARGRSPEGAAGARWGLVEDACRGRGVEAVRASLDERADDVAAGPRVAAFLDSLVRTAGGPTALWSNSHALAPTLLEGLALADVSLPADVSFLTFGDSPWAAAYRPGISVVRSDLGAIGTTLARFVLDRLGVVDPLPPPAVEPDRYVRRRSVGPAPRR
jgi:DNA-binding LacI/PurR family transcriptional regulator